MIRTNYSPATPQATSGVSPAPAPLSVPSATDLAPRHPSPPLSALAIAYAVLFNTGLYFVTALHGLPRFPGPWEPAATIVAYFRARPSEALLCAFFHFGAAIPLGLFTACAVSRLRFLGVRAAGATIALFGGLATALDMMAGALLLWTMAHPGIAQDPTLLRALYFFQFGLGGPGFSVPFGLLLAGLAVAGGLSRLLPRWLMWSGLALAVCGELSWLALVLPQAIFLIPLTRFPGFLWLIAAGFALPVRQLPAGAPASISHAR